jgi:hypothetical protein
MRIRPRGMALGRARALFPRQVGSAPQTGIAGAAFAAASMQAPELGRRKVRAGLDTRAGK